MSVEVILPRCSVEIQYEDFASMPDDVKWRAAFVRQCRYFALIGTHDEDSLQYRAGYPIGSWVGDTARLELARREALS